MKVCFPVQLDKGVESIVFNHFGSAPVFVVVDTETGSIASIVNHNQHHVPGACNPMKALGNQKVDAVIVGGIGAGALAKLREMGIHVHRSQADTVRENITLLTTRGLPVLTLQGCCGGHGTQGGCSH